MLKYDALTTAINWTKRVDKMLLEKNKHDFPQLRKDLLAIKIILDRLDYLEKLIKKREPRMKGETNRYMR